MPVYSLLNAGARPIWVQMAADPRVYRPVSGVSRLDKACLVGQRYADRDRWIACLIRSGLPVEIYGPGWGAANGSERDPGDHEPAIILGRPRSPTPDPGKAMLTRSARRFSREGPVAGFLRSVSQMAYRRRETRTLTPPLRPNARGSISPQRIAGGLRPPRVCVSISATSGQTVILVPRLIPHVRLRDFEAPMCGACYLTGHSERDHGVL